MARTGRPAAVVADLTPFDGSSVDVRARIGWLLRVNRLASEDPDGRSLTVFARRLQGLGLPVDAPRLSGWEQGKGIAPRPILAGYETLLALPQGQLRSVVDGLLASPGGEPLSVPKPAQVDETMLQQRLDTAYDAVADPGAHGGRWLDLAELLSEARGALLPTSIVEPMILRLLGETMRAVGIAYTTRYGALARLVVHPHWGGVVTRGVQALVRAPGAQGVVDPLTLLGEIADAATVRWLMRVLQEDSGAIQLGAAHSLLNLLGTDSFPAAELETFERVLVEMARTRTGPSAALVTMLAERMGPKSRARLGFAPVEPVPTVPASSAASAASPPAVVAGGPLRKVLDPFRVAARQTLPDVRDPMVERLVREALLSRYVERRHHASLLLMAGPYRAGIASAAATTVEFGTSPVLRHNAAALLSYVSGSAERPTLSRWLAGGPPELQQAALPSLAHGSGVDSSVDLAGLVASRGPLAAPAVYAAGMSGHPALQGWAADAHGSLPLRQAARWWLDTGPAITDSLAA